MKFPERAEVPTFSAASKWRPPIVIHHPQSQAMTQFNELMQALAAV